MEQDLFTKEEAYDIAYYFLDSLYEMTKSDDLGGFLGDMSLSPDGKPMDLAVISDWNRAVEKFKQQKSEGKRPYIEWK